MIFLKKIVLVLIITISFIYSFNTTFSSNNRDSILLKLDSLELSIQEKRRSGTPIESDMQSAEAMMESIDRINSELHEVISENAGDPINDEPVLPTMSKLNYVKTFLTGHSLIDILIIVTGSVAIFSALLLILLKIIIMIKSRLKVLSDKRLVKKRERDRLKQKENLKPKKVIDKNIDRYRIPQEIKSYSDNSTLSNNSETIIADSLEENMMSPINESIQNTTDDSSNLYDRLAKSLQGSDEDKSRSPFEDDVLPLPTEIYTEIPPLKIFEDSMGNPVDNISEIKDTKVGPISVDNSKESIISAFDSGEDVIDIAKRVSMSVDQITLILRLSGRR